MKKHIFLRSLVLVTILQPVLTTPALAQSPPQPPPRFWANTDRCGDQTTLIAQEISEYVNEMDEANQEDFQLLKSLQEGCESCRSEDFTIAARAAGVSVVGLATTAGIAKAHDAADQKLSIVKSLLTKAKATGRASYRHIARGAAIAASMLRSTPGKAGSVVVGGASLLVGAMSGLLSVLVLNDNVSSGGAYPGEEERDTIQSDAKKRTDIAFAPKNRSTLHLNDEKLRTTFEDYRKKSRDYQEKTHLYEQIDLTGIQLRDARAIRKMKSVFQRTLARSAEQAMLAELGPKLRAYCQVVREDLRQNEEQQSLRTQIFQ